MSFFPSLNAPSQNLLILAQLAFPLATACVAIWAIRAQREVNARRIYFDYVKLAFDNPEFAYPKSSALRFDYDAATIDELALKYEKYEWFISLLVGSVEGILEIASDRSVWRLSAVNQLSYHDEYFSRNMNKTWLKLKVLTYRELCQRHRSNSVTPEGSSSA